MKTSPLQASTNNYGRSMARLDPSSLQVPHLAGYLPSSYVSMSPDDQQRAERSAWLRAAHLPADYDDLSPAHRRGRRIATLSSWHDLGRPEVFCTDLDNLVAAMFLWTEFYIKPAECNFGEYFNRDPLHKYDMIRIGCAPARRAHLPAKNLVIAPRGSTKTFTFRQLFTLTVCIRPGSKLVLSEINDERTEEEMQFIRLEIEDNEIIHEDFGARGVLWPKSNRGKWKWNDGQLDFPAMRSSIKGVSFYAKARGRHPIFWWIDDVEDDMIVRESGHHEKFGLMLFPRGLGMMRHDSIVAWTQTRVLGGVVDRAMKVLDEQTDDDEEIRAVMVDDRWDGWTIHNFDLIEEDPETGELHSIYEDHITVADFEIIKRDLDVRAAMSEYRGRAVAAGGFALPRDPMLHGWMRCVRESQVAGGAHEYFLDLNTGLTLPWAQFVSQLLIVGACDLADGTGRDSCFNAAVFVGSDPDGIVYVLDALVKKMLVTDLIREAFSIAEVWGARQLGFETAAMQRVVARLARTYEQELRKEGKTPPRTVPLKQTGQRDRSKHQRIIAGLRPRHETHTIRYPLFREIEDVHGVRHFPAQNARKTSWALLFDQLDTLTDEGKSTYDDAPDALEMAVELLGSRRGRTGERLDENEESMEKWKEAGIEWAPSRIPRSCWTREMHEDRLAQVLGKPTGVTVQMADLDEVNPYE